MATVYLAKPDIALFADPGATLVVIPHLVAAPRTRTREQASVRFEGDEAPTTFRGEGRTRVYDLTARFGGDEHDDMLALIDLIEAAHDAPDGRLQLRTNFFDTPGLNPFEVVTVSNVVEQHLGGKAWDVRFTATTTAHTIEA